MKLQAKDLRLGNRVNIHIESHDFTGGIVTEIKKGSVYVNEIKFDYDALEPIPLTKDWMVKFGYESIQEFLCDISEKASNYLWFEDDIGLKRIESMQIHQIQNLFREFTGTELEILSQHNQDLLKGLNTKPEK